MGQAKLGKHPVDKIEIEPAEKRLADDLKRALETKSSRHGNAPNRAPSTSSMRVRVMSLSAAQILKNLR